MADQTQTNAAQAQQQPAPAPGTATPPAAKKKAARLGQKDAARLGAWLKQAAPILNQHNISPAGVARAACKALTLEVSSNSVTLVAGGIGVEFTEMTPAERIEKLENSVITLLSAQPGEKKAA